MASMSKAMKFYFLQKAWVMLLSSKYGQKFLNTTKKSEADAFKKVSKRSIQKQEIYSETRLLTKLQKYSQEYNQI